MAFFGSLTVLAKNRASYNWKEKGSKEGGGGVIAQSIISAVLFVVYVNWKRKKELKYSLSKVENYE